jgi:hypothetical protein
MKKITKISNRIIRRFNPCYDPSELGSKESEYLPIVEAVEKYRSKIKNKSDVVWLLCRKEFMTEKDMRLFAVWCTREALELLKNPDSRSVEACNVAERFANGKATIDELDAAWAAAWAADKAVVKEAAWAADRDAAKAAAWAAAWVTDWAADRDAQTDKLLTYFR